MKQSTRDPKDYKCIKKLYYFMFRYPKIMKKPILMPNLTKVITQKFDKEKSNMIYNKIIERSRYLPSCME